VDLVAVKARPHATRASPWSTRTSSTAARQGYGLT
jgi:hypothetical protein